MTGDHEARFIQAMEKLVEGYEAGSKTSDGILLAIQNFKQLDYTEKLEEVICAFKEFQNVLGASINEIRQIEQIEQKTGESIIYKENTAFKMVCPPYASVLNVNVPAGASCQIVIHDY